MSNDKAQLPNQIQISDEMPKQVRHDKDVILNSFQNPILNVGRKVPRKSYLLGGDQGAESKTPFPFREAPPCLPRPNGVGGELHIHLTFGLQ